MNRRHVVVGIVVVAAALFIGLLSSASAATAQPSTPNFLIIIADDCTFSDLPAYGGRNVKTPHIDRLASEGMLFTHAYVGMSMCVPCRAKLYRALSHAERRLLEPCARHARHPERLPALGGLGYRVGLTGKLHATPRSVFPFEMVPGFEPDCVAMTADHECSGIREFMARDPEQPFYLSVALVVPHVPWSVGDPGHFDRAAIELPPHLADTPQTRDDFARYLAEIEVLDRQVGDILRTLDETGQADRTLVLFTSEQGAQFPGCKWTNWDSGVHTAFIARWPGRIAPGSRTDALVQYADVLPTFVAAAGGAPAAMSFDGTSFLDVLLGKTQEHRRYVYAMHNNVPEGPPYPIRSVRDDRLHYIRNLTPDEICIERHVMGRTEHGQYWLSWMYATPDNPDAYALVRRYMRRPAEELYAPGDDPAEHNNLAGDPRYAADKARLSAELDRWLQSQQDLGAALDHMDQLTAQRRKAAAPPRRPAGAPRSR